MKIPAQPQRGFALPMVAIIIGIVFALSSVVLDAVLSSRQAGKALQLSLAASQIAEAGIARAVACLNGNDGSKCGGTAGLNYEGEIDFSFGGGTFTSAVTAGASNKTITSTGTSAGTSRTVTVDVTTDPSTDPMGFTYALQSGAGGAWMENNSVITGSIYSNGNIECKTTSARITGDAYSAKVGGKIDKCRVDYHAHADSILSSTVGGNAYYNVNPAGVSGTTVTGTKYSGQATPTTTTLPAVDLQFWRNSASTCPTCTTYVGNYAPADNSTIGPMKIVGNLVMNNNVDVTIAGPIWVVGDITTGNSNTFTIASAFGPYSTAILADDEANQATKGRITISNNTGIYGSGSSTSHLLFISTNSSTSDTVPAMSISNNASGAVFYATNGTLRLQNNGGAKSLAGYRLFLDNNAVVTYVQSEFTGEFSNSPATSWRTVDGTWREKTP